MLLRLPMLRLIFALLALSGGFCPFRLEASGAASASVSEVLVLHSRDSMNDWTRGLNDGLRTELSRAGVDLSFEYLDYREHGSEVYREALYDYVKMKYGRGGEGSLRRRRLALIVPMGEYAIDFVAEYRDDLFPGVPVVFSGPMKGRDSVPYVKGFAREATGVINGVDYRGNVELTRRLHPDRPLVFLLFENTPEGRLQASLAEEQLAELPDREGIELLSGSELKTSEMLRRIREAQDRAVVVFKSWGIDVEGVIFDETYGFEQLHALLEVPIYRVAESSISHGLAGGMMVFPELQALETAQLALRVLAGERPDALAPVVSLKSAPVLYFDEMERWGVPESRWPEGAIVRNRPITLWTEYRGAVIVAILVFLSQGIAVVCLSFVLKIKRRLAEERRMNALRLEEANVALETKNEELAENLERAKKLTRELEIANQSKTEFLSVMSHELRTPLNPIIGYADLLSDMIEDREQREYLATIRSTGSHLLQLIDAILDYGRASATVSEGRKEEFLMGEMVEEAAALFRSKAGQKGVKVWVSTEEVEVVEARIDRHAVMQVVLNLVSNAVKFTREGSVTLRWSVRRETERRNYFCLEVEDTGIGISPSFKDAVFAAFTQEDSSMRRRHEGIGLGLAISKKIAEKLGGSLSFESELGRGTTFRFEIPIELARRRAGEEVALGMAGEACSSREYHGTHFLVVDDQLENRSLMAELVKRQGWTCSQAADGLEAVTLFREGDFAAILMDVRMPNVDGIQATQLIREQGERGRRVPIIAMTAHASASVRDKCFEVGMNDFVLKPIRVKETVEVIKRWICADPELVAR